MEGGRFRFGKLPNMGDRITLKRGAMLVEIWHGPALLSLHSVSVVVVRGRSRAIVRFSPYDTTQASSSAFLRAILAYLSQGFRHTHEQTYRPQPRRTRHYFGTPARTGITLAQAARLFSDGAR